MEREDGATGKASEGCRIFPRGSLSPRPAELSPTPLPPPVPLTSFVGREDVVAAIAGILRQPEIRLLTLTGPGGVGKTRLAIKMADELTPAFTDGVGFIALADVKDPTLALPAIAHRLGVREGDRGSLMERLGAHLGRRHCLLVLDNFEQIISAGPVLPGLLGACPNLTLLVTSRAPLRVSGERVAPIPPLSLPSPGTGAGALDTEAVRLFVTRAEAVNPGVTRSDATGSAVAEICARLDGLPLAIELAATRCSLLAPSAMLAALERRLPLLASGPRDQPARLRTMANAIGWSYELLTPDERALFRRLSVFVGGFSLAAAAAVGDESERNVLANLEALVDHSLVQALVNAAGEPRYAMLETIREFGRDQLDAVGQGDDAQERHARYFLALAERIDPEIDHSESTPWLALLDLDRANLQAALTWLTQHQQTGSAMRLAAALWRYWRIRGHLSEGRDSLDRALALPGTVPPVLRADALSKYGYLLSYLGEDIAARAHLERSAALFADAGDQVGEATALDSVGTVLRLQRDFRGARAALERALALRREMDDRFEVELPMANLGMLALDRGDLGEARALLEESLAISQRIGSRREVGNRYINLARLELAEGHLGIARAYLDRCLDIVEEIGDQVHIATALEVCGQVASERGEPSRGIGDFVRSLHLRLKVGLYRNLNEFLERMACAVVSRDARLATRMLAAAHADRERTDVSRLAGDESAWKQAVATARDALGADRFGDEWRQGTRLSLVAVSREAEAALGGLAPAGMAPTHIVPDAAPTGSPGHDLTPRELEVLRLVAAGHSNRAIAGTLFISPATVKRHLSTILAKLDVPSRTAASALAQKLGIIQPDS